MVVAMSMQHLRELLKRKGVKQVQLAGLLGRDKSAITNLLQGKRQLKASEVVKIAEFLGVTEAEVLGKEKPADATMADSGRTGFVVAPSATSQPGGSDKSQLLIVPDNAMNLSGILQGDHLSYDEVTSAKSGDIIVVEFKDGETTTQSLRKYQPPFLVPHSSESHHQKLHEDRASVKLIGSVTQLIRNYR